MQTPRSLHARAFIELMNAALLILISGVLPASAKLVENKIFTDNETWAPDGWYDQNGNFTSDNSSYMIYGQPWFRQRDFGDKPVLKITSRKRDGSHADVEIIFNLPSAELVIGDDFDNQADIVTEVNPGNRIILKGNRTNQPWGKGLRLQTYGITARTSINSCTFQYLSDPLVIDNEGQCQAPAVANPVRDCIFQNNFGIGIRLSGKCDISDCLILNNASHGILMGTCAEAAVTGCTISSNNGYGIYGTGSSIRPLTITGCLFADNAGNALRIPASSNYDANTFEGNHGGDQWIELNGGVIDASRNYTFFRNDSAGHEVNYHLFSDVTFEADDPGDTINVVIEPGVTFKVQPGKGITCTSSQGTLNLSAQGTVNNPITFTAIDNAGDHDAWKGIVLDHFNTAMFQHCVVEYGGSGSDGTVTCKNSGLLTLDNCTIQSGTSNGIFVENNGGPVIDNCTIQDNARDGISITFQETNVYGSVKNSVIRNNRGNGIGISTANRNGRENHTEIRNNDFDSNTSGLVCEGEVQNIRPALYANTFRNHRDIPVAVSAQMLLDAQNTFGANAVPGIKLLAANICSDTHWYNFGVPYMVCRNGNNNIVQISACAVTDDPATLTIDNGTTVMFEPDVAVRIGAGGQGNPLPGVLIANGKKDSPITFTARYAGAYWNGIEFDGNGQGVLNHCIVEYGGNGTTGANITFSDSNLIPGWGIIRNTTVRYSKGDGLAITGGSGGVIRNCNIYGNALTDLVGTNTDARLNFWGTPGGPSADLCSSAVVSDDVMYEAWLGEAFTDVIRFTDAGDNNTNFEPIVGSTTINFTLSQQAEWTLSILNRQFETLWSTSGSGGSGAVTWDGMGDYGIVTGLCYYRIEARGSAGEAAPAMGVLVLGEDELSVAQLTEPVSGSVYKKGATIDIKGIAYYDNVTACGTYRVYYRDTGNWTEITSGEQTSNKNDALLAQWNTGTNPPSGTTAYIKLKVTATGSDPKEYADMVTVHFYQEDPVPDNRTATIAYGYDSLGRLTKVVYPISGATGDVVLFTYDKVGNRLRQQREAPSLIELASFSARPTLKGIVLSWQTASEHSTAGFNLYRTMLRAHSYERVNTSLIPAMGSATSGATYTLTDIPPRAGRRWSYLLEEVETDGSTRKYGPVTSGNISIGSIFKRREQWRSGGVPGKARAFRKAFDVHCD